MVNLMKTCNDTKNRGCLKEKEISEFSKNAGNADGLMRLCKSCCSRLYIENYSTNSEFKEKRIAYGREWHKRPEVQARRTQRIKTDPEFSKKVKEWQRKSRQKPESKAKHRDSTLRREFGISLKEYNSMLETQHRVCAICEQKCDIALSLAVDHCHTSGKVRGLLCSRCNTGLGLFRDAPQLLEKAKQYLVRSG